MGKRKNNLSLLGRKTTTNIFTHLIFLQPTNILKTQRKGKRERKNAYPKAQRYIVSPLLDI